MKYLIVFDLGNDTWCAWGGGGIHDTIESACTTANRALVAGTRYRLCPVGEPGDVVYEVGDSCTSTTQA